MSINPSPRRDTLELGSIRAPALVAGPDDGPTVIFLHGSADSPGCWRGVMPWLARAGFRCWAPVVSAAWRPGVDDALDVDLDLLSALADAAGRPARFVGHSYGALAALRFALTAPDAVSHLALCEPIAFGLLDRLPGGRGRMAQLRRRFFEPVARGAPEIGLQWLVDYWNGPGAWATLPAPAREGLAADTRRVVAEVTSGLRDRTHAEELRRLTMPTLVLAGQHTTRESLAVCEELARALPAAEHRLIVSAGHQMSRSHPEAVAEGLLALFSRPR